jgi:TusA-related sulfurtransferase
MQIDREIDARGLNCPLPLMKAKKALGEMHSGQVLRVVATDSGSLRDILAFAKQAGHEMVEQKHVGNEYIHVIRRH